MKTIFSKANQILSGFTGWLLLAMMFLLLLDIVSRFIQKPVQGMAELSVFVLMIVIYLGMARCEEHNEHVNIEMITNRLSPSIQRFLPFLNKLVALGTVGILFYAVFMDAAAAYQRNETLFSDVEYPIWPTKFIMVIGLVFYLFQILVNLFDAAKKLKKR